MDTFNYLNNRLNGQNFKNDIPLKLYKYRPFDKFTFDMLKNKYVYLCPAEKLDDPTECFTTVDYMAVLELEHNNLKWLCTYIIFNYLRPYMSPIDFQIAYRELCQILNTDGTVKTYRIIDFSREIQNMLSVDINISPWVNWIAYFPKRLDEPTVKDQIRYLIQFAAKSRKELGICSLCERCDLEYMWTNYAAKGSGYCIEYEMQGYGSLNMLFPVVYTDERETNIVVQILENFIAQHINGMNGKNTVDTSQYLRLFITKNLKWQQQKEWRLIGDAGTKLPAPEIKRIILGKNVNMENKNKMMNYCEKSMTVLQ